MALWQYASTEETTNSCRVSRALIDPCTDQMRDVLRHHIPPANFPQVIRQQKHKLPKLTKPQFDLILPRSGHYTGNYSDFDISLLYTLLRNICNIPAHSKGWGKDPDPNDMSLSANIERIRDARNTAVGHMTSSSLSNTDFNAIWSTIRTAVVQIDTFLKNNQKYEKAVDFLRNETMDPQKDKEYERKLHDQVKEDTETRQMIEKTNQTIKDQEVKFEQLRIAGSARQDKTDTDIQRHDADILYMRQQTDELISGQDKTDYHIQRHDAEILYMKQQTEELTARQDKIDAEILHRKQEWVDHKTTTASIQDQPDEMRADVENLKQQEEKNEEPNMNRLKDRLLEEALLIPLSEVTEDSDKLPMEHLFSSVVIREDAKTAKEVKGPDDMLKKNGKEVDRVFMLGKAAHGKTTYCKWLLKTWGDAQRLSVGGRPFTKWEDGFRQFDFVFHIPLRHVDPSRANVTDMICQDILDLDTDLQATVQNVLSCDDYRCFIILDGLDEWKPVKSVKRRLKNKGMPNTGKMSNNVIFTTMRPWKFSEVSEILRSNATVIEIEGLDDKGIESVIENVLVNYYELKPDTIKYKAKHQEIIRNLENATLKSFIKIPLLAVVCVQIWYEGEQVGDSMTSFYIAMVNMLIQRAHLKHDTQKLIFKAIDVSLPTVMTGKKNIKNYLNVLLKLGKVAYNGLLSKEIKLVFQKDDLETELGENELKFALDVGLISQRDVHSVVERKVSVQFFHKSIQEFLAAIHIVTHKNVRNSFCKHLRDIRVIIELSNVIMFVCGMCPSSGTIISQRVVSVTNSDTEVCQYRESQLPLSAQSTVRELHKLQVIWNKELQYGQTGIPKTDSSVTDSSAKDSLVTNSPVTDRQVIDRLVTDSTVTDSTVTDSTVTDSTMIDSTVIDSTESPLTCHLSDVYLCHFINIDTAKTTREILFHHPVDIRSLWLEFVPTDGRHGITKAVINNFLCNTQHTRSLIMVHINGNGTDRTVNRICGLSLRTLYLRCVTVPSTPHGPLLCDCYRLQRLYLYDITLGDRDIGLTSSMSLIQCVWLERVKMTELGWGRWLQSVIDIQHKFVITLYDTNIDRHSVCTIRSSPHLTTTQNNSYGYMFTRVWPLTQENDTDIHTETTLHSSAHFFMKDDDDTFNRVRSETLNTRCCILQ